MKKPSLKIFRNIYSNIIISLLLILFVSLTVSSSVGVFSSNHIDAIYNGNKNNKNVTLMVNVYWGSEYLTEMLDIFDEYDVNTTFFVGGVWVAKNNDLLRTINDRGHEIGNHGYYHKDHTKITEERNRQEIVITHKLVKEVCGVEMNLFAPPSGAYDENTLQIASEEGYKTIMFSKDTIDWRDKDSSLILKRATRKIYNGDLILLHPTKNTLEALPKIIETLKNSGFSLVSVSENIA